MKKGWNKNLLWKCSNSQQQMSCHLRPNSNSYFSQILWIYLHLMRQPGVCLSEPNYVCINMSSFISQCVCRQFQVYLFSRLSSGSLCSSFPPGSLCKNKQPYSCYHHFMVEDTCALMRRNNTVTLLWLISVHLLLNTWKKIKIKIALIKLYSH